MSLEYQISEVKKIYASSDNKELYLSILESLNKLEEIIKFMNEKI